MTHFRCCPAVGGMQFPIQRCGFRIRPLPTCRIPLTTARFFPASRPHLYFAPLELGEMGGCPRPVHRPPSPISQFPGSILSSGNAIPHPTAKVLNAIPDQQDERPHPAAAKAPVSIPYFPISCFESLLRAAIDFFQPVAKSPHLWWRFTADDSGMGTATLGTVDWKRRIYTI